MGAVAEHRWLGEAHAEASLATGRRGLRVQATALRQTQGSTGAMGHAGGRGSQLSSFWK